MNRQTQTDNTDLQRNDDHEQTDRQTDNTDLQRNDDHEQTDRQTTLRQTDNTDLQRNDDHEQSFLPVSQDMLDEGPASSDQQDRHKHQRSASPATGNRNSVSIHCLPCWNVSPCACECVFMLYAMNFANMYFLVKNV